MTIQTKVLGAVGVLLLAGLALWAVSDSWSAVPVAGTGTPSPGTVVSADLPNDSAPGQLADAAQRSPAPPAVAAPDETGLLVHAVYGDDRSPAAGLVLIVSPVDEDARLHARRARTDEQGNARFDGLAAGRVRVQDNHLAGGMAAEIQPGKLTEIEFVLRPGIDVTGLVVDRDGLPVPGAEVFFAHSASSGTDAEHAATTDLAGRFALRCCGNPLLVGARALGHAPSRLKPLFDEKGIQKFDVRIELPGPGGAVEGIVVGPGGSPVAGAIVRIGKGRVDLVLTTSSGAPPLPAQVRTDRDGHFRAVGLVEGEHAVVVRAPSLAPWHGTCHVAANGIAALSVMLGKGVTLSGTVHDSEGLPVPQASVTVGTEGDVAFYRTRSAADGAFRLTGLPVVEFDLAAVHEKSGKATRRLRGSAGETLPCDVQLSLGLALRGRLLFESGDVAQGRVSASAEAGNGEPRGQAGAKVDAEGRFLIGNCPDGRLLTVRVEGGKLVTARQHRVDPRAGELVVRVKKKVPLPPESARITGTLVRADGKPAASIMVNADVLGSGGLATTDENGHFAIGPIVPGMVRFSVDLDELPLFRSERELAADATWDLGTLRLVGGTILVRYIGQTQSVQLRLYDPQGVWVTNIEPATPPFRSRSVVPGRYQLSVSGPEIAAMTLPVEVRENEATTVDVRPQRGLAQKIEFRSAAGWQNVPWLSVTITSASGLWLQATASIGETDPPTLSCRLVPGSYTVTAKAEGVSGRAEFTVAEDADAATVRVTVQ